MALCQMRRPGAPAPRRPAGWVGFVSRNTQLQVRDVANGEVRHQPDVNG